MGMSTVDKYAMEMIMHGQEKIMQQLEGISGGLGKVAYAAEKTSKATAKSGKTVKKAGEEMEKAGKHARGFSGNILNMMSGMKGVIATGMLMSIGWQAINGILTTVTTAIRDMVFGGIELEASMVSLGVVAEKTGRNFGEVMGVINKHTDAFMTRGQAMQGTLRLLSTELSTDQMDKFIMAVKEGSAAMGYQAGEQLPLIARGYKQLTANILDNIGVTIYLEKVKRRAAKEFDVSIDALTEAQIHQTLYNVIIEQTAKYTGLYAKQLDTAKGSIEKITTSWAAYTETVGKTEPIKQAADALSGLIDWTTKLEKQKILRAEYGIRIIDTDVMQETAMFLQATDSSLKQIGIVIEAITGKTKAPVFISEKEAETIDVVSASIQGMIKEIDIGRISIEDIEGAYVTYLKAMGEADAEAVAARVITVALADAKEAESSAVDETTEAWKDYLDAIAEAGEEAKKTHPYYTDLTDIASDLEAEISKLQRVITINTEALEENDATLLKYKEGIIEVTRAVVDEKAQMSYLVEGYGLMKEITYDIGEYQTKTFIPSIKGYNKAVKEVTESIRNLTQEQRELDREIKKDESTIEKMNRALGIETLQNYEKLINVTRELERSLSKQERAQDKLYKRVEPTLYKKYMKEAREADEDVNKAQKEQSRLMTIVKGEVKDLSGVLAENKTKQAELTTEIGIYEDAQSDLQGTLDTQRGIVDNLTTSNKLMRLEYDDLMDNKEIYEDALDDINSLIETTGINAELSTKQIDAMASSLEALADIPDIEKSITTKIEKVYTSMTEEEEEPYSFLKSEYRPKLPWMKQGGGFIGQTGMYMLHQGEKVSTAMDTRQENTTNNRNVTFSTGAIVINATGGSSAEAIYREFERRVSTELLRRQAI